jgi:hypothetical protein
MKTIRFLGPAAALEIGDVRLERDGEPQEVSDAQFEQISAQPERWQIETVRSRATAGDKPGPARARRTARRPAGTGRRATTGTSATSVTDTREES